MTTTRRVRVFVDDETPPQLVGTILAPNVTPLWAPEGNLADGGPRVKYIWASDYIWISDYGQPKVVAIHLKSMKDVEALKSFDFQPSEG